MRVRGFALVVLLLAALPVHAQVEEERASPPRIGPVRIVILDGCLHALFQRAAGKSRTSVPVEINTSAEDVVHCSIDFRKAQAALGALARQLEAERSNAAKHHLPVPLALLYTGSTVEGPGAGGVWRKAVERLSQSALFVSPGGNDPDNGAGEVWPSGQFSFHVGSAPDGGVTGTIGPEISVFVDYGDELEFVVNGEHVYGGGSSTAAMLLSAHLANVLTAGAGGSLTPPQILKKLKAAFHGEVVKEEDLEERLARALR
jgi:hypothetical protein